MYEYGARNYDPAVGRFFNIDRLSEKYENISPYNYTANNPVRFVDVDGEWIYISDQGQQYRYVMGGNVEMKDKETGEWNLVEDKTSLSTYVQQIIEGIYQLESSGPTGGAVAGYFNNSRKNVYIKDLPKVFGMAALGYNINIDLNFVANDIFTTVGMKEAIFYVTLGHEMAHVIDAYENPNSYKDLWLKNSTKDITRSEIFATHIENQIRSESGLPLRRYYGNTEDSNTGTVRPLRQSLLIDKNGNSLFYQQTAPTIFNTLQRGEIFNNKYKHVEETLRYNYNATNPKTTR